MTTANRSATRILSPPPPEIHKNLSEARIYLRSLGRELIRASQSRDPRVVTLALSLLERRAA